MAADGELRIPRDAGVAQRLIEPGRAFVRRREVGRPRDLGDAPVAQAEQVPAEQVRAAAVVGKHRVRVGHLAAAHDHARALAAQPARLLRQLLQVVRIADRAAGQDHRVGALPAQHLDVPELAAGVAQRVAQDDQPLPGRRHLLDAGDDLREVGVGDVVDDDTDQPGRRDAQRLRVGVPDVAELPDRVLDARSRLCGDRIPAVEHARHGGRRHVGHARDVSDGRGGRSAAAARRGSCHWESVPMISDGGAPAIPTVPAGDRRRAPLRLRLREREQRGGEEAALCVWRQ